METLLLLLLSVTLSAALPPKRTDSPIDSSLQVTTKISYCDSAQRKQIIDAQTEAQKILKRADNRLRDLYQFIEKYETKEEEKEGKKSKESNVVGDEKEAEEAVPLSGKWPTIGMASVAHTYSSIIDPYFIPTLTEPITTSRSLLNDQQSPAFVDDQGAFQRGKTERKASLQRMKSLVETLGVMKNVVFSPRYEITCGVTWISPENNQKKRKKDVGFDNRNSLKFEERKLQEVEEPSGDPNKWDLASFQNLHGQFSMVVALNSHKLATKWSASHFEVDEDGAKELSLTKMADDTKYKSHQWQLGELQPHHLSLFLIVALAGLPLIAEPSLRLNLSMNDMPESYKLGAGTVWSQINFIAIRNPKTAANNVENFRFLVSALFLEHYDWSTGWNEDPSSEALLPVKSIKMPP